MFEALSKRDTPRATELLKDRDTHLAYRARLGGERWQPPVEVAKAEPDRGAEIRKAVAEGDVAGLDRLVRLPTAAGSTTSC